MSTATDTTTPRLTAKELAARLDGRHYGREITSREETDARAAGLVVAFGYSNDVVRIRGAVQDSADAWGGTTVYLTPTGLVLNDCADDDCPHYARATRAAASVKAVWRAPNAPDWTFETDIPHSTFDIIDPADGAVCCRGIVFALADATGAP